MPDRGRSLLHVRAAQLRAQARRGAIGRIILGMVFLVGALAYARAPDRHSRGSLLWMTGLLILSTADVALGVRALSRLRRRGQTLWVAAAALWGVLATVVVGFLLRG